MNQVSLELIRDAQRVRERLRRPPNAKPDTGIDLTRRPRLGFHYQGEGPKPEPIVIPITSVEQMQEIIVERLDAPRPVINTMSVIRKVAAFYGLTAKQLQGPVRRANIVWPRHVACYLCHEVLHRSYPEIGRKMGDRDHTSILNSVKQIKRHVLLDGELASDVAHLEAQLIEEMEGVA